MVRLPGIHVDWKFKMAVNSAGYNLRTLETATGISRTVLSEYATGRSNLSAVERQKIARALKKRVEEVFTNWSDDMVRVEEKCPA